MIQRMVSDKLNLKKKMVTTKLERTVGRNFRDKSKRQTLSSAHRYVPPSGLSVLSVHRQSSML